MNLSRHCTSLETVQGSSKGVLGWTNRPPGDADVRGDPGHFQQTNSRRDIEEKKKQKTAQRKIDNDKCSAWKSADYYMTEEGQFELGETIRKRDDPSILIKYTPDQHT